MTTPLAFAGFGRWTAALLAAAVGVGSLTSGHGAAVPTLQSPRVSKAGNISMIARGDEGSVGWIEVSPNLADWVRLDAIALTEAGTAWYLRPQGRQLFSRIRTPDAGEAPAPATFKTQLNPDFHKTLFATDQGDTMKLTDDNGLVYQVNLGADSLMSPEDVVMDIVNDTAGLPAGFQYLGGIRLGPSGRWLYADASVVITFPQGTDLTHIAAIAWDKDGMELHLTSRTIQGLQITLPLSRLGGIGLVRYVDLSPNPIINAFPTRFLDQVEQASARAQLGLPKFQESAAASYSSQIAPPPIDPCPERRGNELLFQRIIIPGLSAAIADDSLLEDALFNYLIIGRAMAAEPPSSCNDTAEALADHCDDLAILALEHSIDLAVVHCKQHDLRALVRLWRDARWTSTGRWARKFGAAQRQAVVEKLRACAQFKFEMFSSTAYTGPAGTVRSSVSSAFPLRMSSQGTSLAIPIQGDGEMTLDATEWIDPVSPCSPSSAPTSGHAAVLDLYLLDFAYDLDKLVVHTDTDIPRPRYGLLIDPLVLPAGEHYTLTCRGIGVPQGPSFWASVFGSFHKDRIRKTPSGRQAMWFVDWTYDSDSSPEHKEYQTTGSIGSQTGNENTVLNLYFTGGDN